MVEVLVIRRGQSPLIIEGLGAFEPSPQAPARHTPTLNGEEPHFIDRTVHMEVPEGLAVTISNPRLRQIRAQLAEEEITGSERSAAPLRVDLMIGHKPTGMPDH
ncbi:hypothetical protein KW076_04225 [Micrococcus porci]|uniref:hypothetical protein n=1 Tax=Micrococcus porci TaxID=2856555 RepID=UPI001CCA2733|nr:hypothetical protein [Micrococcus porci]UBH25404.1 hypothetical protein KW076_04225 [Micrococcus porci]